MRTFLRKQYLIASISLILFFALLIGLWGNQAIARLIQPSGPPVIYQHDFGTWSYVAKMDPISGISAEVRFESSSIQGIQAFATANKALASQLATTDSQHPILVVFKTPMELSTYRAWAQKAGIAYFTMIYIKGVDGRNAANFQHPLPPIQITIPSNSSEALNQVKLDEAVKSLTKDIGANVTVEGVDGFQAMVDSNRLPVIAADPQVLIADVTTSIIRSDLQAAGITNADQAGVYDPLPIFNIQELVNQKN